MRRRQRATWAVGAATVAILAWWAWSPLERGAEPDITIRPNQASPESAVPGSERLDVAAFAALLWNSPATSTAAEAVPETMADQATPMRIQLIGIIRENGRLTAALYDPDGDRLLVVASGDRIRQHTVTEITDAGIELSDGHTKRRLELRKDQT